MMERDEARLRDIEIRVAQIEAKVDSHMDDIREIKAMQQQILKWIVGALGISLLTLVTVTLNLIKDRL